MYTLYYSPGACSMAVHIVLNEVGQTPELIKVSTKDGEQRKPEFLKINPQGAVPVLVDDGQVILEGAAQIAYLCDKHKSPLIPASGIERAKALQWLSFANATMHPAYSRGFAAKGRWKFNSEDERQNIMNQILENIQNLWNNVEAHLAANGPYLVGANVTAGDILLSVIANWQLGSFSFGPKTKAWLKAVSARPSYQKALATEQVEYKAAA